MADIVLRYSGPRDSVLFLLCLSTILITSNQLQLEPAVATDPSQNCL